MRIDNRPAERVGRSIIEVGSLVAPMKSITTPNQADLWKKRLGKHGENIVLEALEKRGWTILERNWRDGKKAEIDIICRDPEGMYVFVEVKTRCKPGTEAGFQTEGFDSITRIKQQKIVTSARNYLAQRNLLYVRYRFDVVVVAFNHMPKHMPKIENPESLMEPTLTHVQSAIGGF